MLVLINIGSKYARLDGQVVPKQQDSQGFCRHHDVGAVGRFRKTGGPLDRSCPSESSKTGRIWIGPHASKAAAQTRETDDVLTKASKPSPSSSEERSRFANSAPHLIPAQIIRPNPARRADRTAREPALPSTIAITVSGEQEC